AQGGDAHACEHGLEPDPFVEPSRLWREGFSSFGLAAIAQLRTTIDEHVSVSRNQRIFRVAGKAGRRSSRGSPNGPGGGSPDLRKNPCASNGSRRCNGQI